MINNEWAYVYLNKIRVHNICLGTLGNIKVKFVGKESEEVNRTILPCGNCANFKIN